MPIPKDYEGMDWVVQSRAKSSPQSPKKRQRSQSAGFTLRKPDELPTQEGEKPQKRTEQSNSPLLRAYNRKSAGVSPNEENTVEDADELSTTRHEPTKGAEQSSSPLSRPPMAKKRRVSSESNDHLQRLDEISTPDAERPDEMSTTDAERSDEMSAPDAERPRRHYRNRRARPDIRGLDARRMQRAEKNRHVDRTTAKLGEFDYSKQQLQIIDLDDQTLSLEYSVPVDWNDPQSISALNIWRNAFFRSWLGPLYKMPQSHTSDLEEDHSWRKSESG